MKNAWKSFGWGAALIVLLTTVAYLPALRGGFIWDDDDYVTNNRTLRSVEGLQHIWLNPEATVQYYPLTFTVFWVEYHLWGLQPFGFHLVNILLHAANALLFWRLLSRLKVPGAWWAAAVFALHPVHVMSVAWITELKNVLSGFCFLAALLAYLRFSGWDEDRAVGRAGRSRFYGLALALYFCALLSKTSTSLLPVAILLILWWKQKWIGRRELVPLLPLVIVGIQFGAFTLWLEKHAKGATGQEFNLTFLERFVAAGRSFWFCLGKLVWPARLTFIYPRWPIETTNPWLYLFPLSALGLLAALWWTRRWVGRAPLAALVYFTLAFPALVLVQVLYMMQYTFVADHWQYLGSMSIIPLGVAGAVMAIDRWAPAFRRTGPLIGTAVIATLGLLTWRQGHIYQDSATLWRDTLAKNPTAWMAHNNLGSTLSNQGKYAEAIAEFRESLRINPGNVEALKNLGAALVRLGRVPEAIHPWEQVLRIRPDYAEAHNDLGSALMQVGKLQDAVGHYEQALRIKPDFAEAHNNFGIALVRLGRMPEAIGQFEQAVRFKPGDAEAHYNLGIVLEKAGRVPDAILQFEQVLRIEPGMVDAQNKLARLRAASK